MIAQDHVIYQTIQSKNILPLTSRCNASCLFCSHRGNPANVKIYTLPELTRDDLNIMMDFLKGEEKIIIGESASTIIEGEPFLFDEIKWVLYRLRDKFPKALIQITTNGNIKDRVILKILKEIGNVSLNISVNSLDRVRVMAIEDDYLPGVLDFLTKEEIYFTTSMVAIPGMTDWDTMKASLNFMLSYNPKLINVYLPGYTKYTPKRFVDNTQWETIIRWVDGFKTVTEIPIIIEPNLVKEISPKVAGVIKDSPGDLAGIMAGDIISEVDYCPIETRVDLYNILRSSNNPKAKVIRGNHVYYKAIEKGKGQQSGIIVSYDLPLSVINKIKRELSKWIDPIIMTSPLAKDLFFSLFGECHCKIVKVINNTFGGNIQCAGLLTVDDFIYAIDNEMIKGDAILLPSSPFNYKGVDIKGEHYSKIEDYTGVPVIFPDL